MANTKGKGTTSAKTTVKAAEPVEDVKITAKDIDLGQYITVKNGFQGKLVYVSSRTGEKFVWDGFGSEQEMDLRELRNAKNSSKRFFIDNWFMFSDEDDWVIDFLGVRQYYRSALSINGFDDLFTKSPADLKKAIEALSNGQRRSVAYRATELIASGDIDSRKTIAALEESLGIELVEK